MDRVESCNSVVGGGGGRENGEDAHSEMDEQEKVFLALIEHRKKEIERNKWRVAHYKAELEQSERKLEETEVQLSRLRLQHSLLPSQRTMEFDMPNVKVERRSASPSHYSPDSPQSLLQTKSVQDSVQSSMISQGDVKRLKASASSMRPQIAIPAVNPLPSKLMKAHLSNKDSNGSDARATESVPTFSTGSLKQTREKSSKTISEQETVQIQAKGTKRKFEQKEHRDLIGLIASCSTVSTINCRTGSLISSQHKRKLRSLILCPTNDRFFVTSALDGVVNLWEVQARGSSANFLSSTDCSSVKKRRWPEDIAWHPHGNSVFTVYSADGGDAQVAMVDLNKPKERTRVYFLEDKPHVKGIINNIMFMPWEDAYFVTGGSDHAVVMWSDKDDGNNWKPKALHRSLHSSAVMGVAGLQHKQTVISVGADKRITGFDVRAGRADYKHQIESKCMSVVPNPCDFNLFMVQTGTPGRQLRLYDYRLRQTEIHAFGWEQEISESQSALINQAWSPDGLYITSGSADPVIHIFDIRYNAKKPTQSIKAHQKRVFKAVWHHALPLLISISSDLNIGLHKIA